MSGKYSNRGEINTTLWLENLMGTDHLGGEVNCWLKKNTEINLRVRYVYGGVDWIKLSYDKVQWRDFLNTIMKLHVPIR
jgi:hypothetical protein